MFQHAKWIALMAAGALVVAGVFQPSHLLADRLCVRKKVKVVKGTVNLDGGVLKTAKTCPSTHVEVFDTSTLAGEESISPIYKEHLLVSKALPI